MDFLHAHTPCKPEEGAHGPFAGFTGWGQDPPLFFAEVSAEFQGSEGDQREPHVTSHPPIRRNRGGVKVNQGAELTLEEVAEGGHIVRMATFPDVGQAQGGAASAVDGAHAIGMLAAGMYPYVYIVDR